MAVDSTAGVSVTGELLSVTFEEGTLDNGKPWSKGVVKLLIGDNVERIGFKTLEEAEAAVGQGQRGDLVSVGARPQGAYDEATGRRSRVTWRGVAS